MKSVSLGVLALAHGYFNGSLSIIKLYFTSHLDSLLIIIFYFTTAVFGSEISRVFYLYNVVFHFPPVITFIALPIISESFSIINLYFFNGSLSIVIMYFTMASLWL